MPSDELSVLLEGTYASTRHNSLADGLGFLPRTVPSAGGLYPLEVYVVLQRVETIPDGLYHYDVRGHGLEPMKSGMLFDVLCACLAGQDCFVSANVVIVFSAMFERTLSRYGARGYRYILFEAGHAAQNLCLIATERGLGSLCMGSFFDTKLNQFLGLDGVGEAALYSVAVGYPTE